MKINEIKLNALINIGPYSHVTMDISASVEQGDNALIILKQFRDDAVRILNSEVRGADVEEAKQEPVTFDEETKQNLPVSEVKEKKEKKTKVKKEVAPEETSEEYAKKQPPKEEKKKPYVKYDSNVAEHKSIFGGYLNKKYGNAWKEAKPKEEIQSFTKALNGKEFLDDAGQIVESFLNEVHSFFGN